MYPNREESSSAGHETPLLVSFTVHVPNGGKNLQLLKCVSVTYWEKTGVDII